MSQHAAAPSSDEWRASRGRWTQEFVDEAEQLLSEPGYQLTAKEYAALTQRIEELKNGSYDLTHYQSVLAFLADAKQPAPLT